MLTLICGLPRAGKTTYSKQFDCPVIHLDNLGSTYNVISKVKRMSGDIVVEGVFHDAQKRTELIRAYNGDYSRCIWLDTPREVREERLGYKLRKDYPFPVPTYSEGWDEIIIIRGDNNVKGISNKG